MKIALVTDTWIPDTNNISTSLWYLYEIFGQMGHELYMVHPGMFENVPCPGFPNFRLSKHAYHVEFVLRNLRFDAIHIATEGPLGWEARAYCLRHKIAFTTSYNFDVPKLLQAKFKIPQWLTYHYLHKFHDSAHKTFVNCSGMKTLLGEHDFKNINVVGLGVDVETFNPKWRALKGDTPIFLNVGPVSKDRNLQAFYEAGLPGRIIQVGDGPALDEFKQKYQNVEFLGSKSGTELCTLYANADVFVFPSLIPEIDPNVLESLASGVPVVAFDTPSVRDVIEPGISGILGDNLLVSTYKALELDPLACVQRAKDFNWDKVALDFLKNLVFKNEK